MEEGERGKATYVKTLIHLTVSLMSQVTLAEREMGYGLPQVISACYIAMMSDI